MASMSCCRSSLSSSYDRLAIHSGYFDEFGLDEFGLEEVGREGREELGLDERGTCTCSENPQATPVDSSGSGGGGPDGGCGGEASGPAPSGSQPESPDSWKSKGSPSSAQTFATSKCFSVGGTSRTASRGVWDGSSWATFTDLLANAAIALADSMLLFVPAMLTFSLWCLADDCAAALRKCCLTCLVSLKEACMRSWNSSLAWLPRS
mmetsp:Transcript_83137/g.262664  ORF Transcript_83137/g.262664 Transcript_83137/m.262664 type:complete len:207 (-) Transcript_83137:170-790(-)